MALTEQQQQKLQVCEKNWVRRITRTKGVDRRRMNDLRKEVGMQCRPLGKNGCIVCIVTEIIILVVY